MMLNYSYINEHKQESHNKECVFQTRVHGIFSCYNSAVHDIVEAPIALVIALVMKCHPLSPRSFNRYIDKDQAFNSIWMN